MLNVTILIERPISMISRSDKLHDPFCFFGFKEIYLVTRQELDDGLELASLMLLFGCKSTALFDIRADYWILFTRCTGPVHLFRLAAGGSGVGWGSIN
jgi:hypothetical protein